MRITQSLKFGIHGFMDELFGAILNTSETVHAFIVNGVNHLTGVESSMIIYPVDTLFLDADGAFQTALFPGDDTRFRDGFEAMGNGLGMNQIFRWHV
jgi:hypothetical protein